MLRLLQNFEAELAAYRGDPKKGGFANFFAKLGVSNHGFLKMGDGSTVIGPPGPIKPNNQYLVKYPNNTFYIGPLNGELRHGQGYRSYPDGKLIYFGNYVDNKKHGAGVLWSLNDRRHVYDGRWANDLKNGYGEMWKDGVTYKGNWRDDKLSGEGRMDWPSGQVYEGQFAQDLRNGQGTMTFANGDTYAGQWRNGRQHGKGTYRWESGEVFEGSWEDGKMNGDGDIIYGIPVRGSGRVIDNAPKQINFNLQRPEEWGTVIQRSEMNIRSMRDTLKSSVAPETFSKFRAEKTSHVGAPGFDGKPPPANINLSLDPSAKPAAQTLASGLMYGATNAERSTLQSKRDVVADYMKSHVRVAEPPVSHSSNFDFEEKRKLFNSDAQGFGAFANNFSEFRSGISVNDNGGQTGHLERATYASSEVRYQPPTMSYQTIYKPPPDNRGHAGPNWW